MRIGLFAAGPGLGASGSWQDIVERFRAAEQRGYSSAWSPQLFGADPIVLSGAAATVTRQIEIGTAVITTRPRHPIVVAQEALSLSAASGGRFTLGLGVGHAPVLARNFGLPSGRPVQHLQEYVEILLGLLGGQHVQFEGKEFTVDARLDVPGGEQPSLLLAALGPNVLDVAGRLSDGTFTWMGGVRYLDEFAVPRITAAAESAGRESPRVVSGFPVAVTNRGDSALAHAANELRLYGRMPSYKAALDRDGADSPTDICIVGTESEVEKRVARIADIGVTDLVVAPLSVPDDPESQGRSLAFLAGLGQAGPK